MDTSYCTFPVLSCWLHGKSKNPHRNLDSTFLSVRPFLVDSHLVTCCDYDTGETPHPH